MGSVCGGGGGEGPATRAELARQAPPATKMRRGGAAPGSGVWIPPSCNQLGLSVTTLGVFLRKHFIADVCGDAQTKGLIGTGWNDLVQPKQSVILDARQ